MHVPASVGSEGPVVAAGGLEHPSEADLYYLEGLGRAKSIAAIAAFLFVLDVVFGSTAAFYAFDTHPWRVRLAELPDGTPLGLDLIFHSALLVTIGSFFWISRLDRNPAEPSRSRAKVGILFLLICASQGVVVGLSHIHPLFTQYLTFTAAAGSLIFPLTRAQLSTAAGGGVLAAITVGLATGMAGSPRVMTNILGLTITVICAIVAIAVNQWNRRNFLLRCRADRRVDELLAGALTRPVSRELKASGGAYEQRQAEVCVIAMDIVGFTNALKSAPRDQVLKELQTIFETFDANCFPQGVEPLRSQGDSRIAIAGLWSEATALEPTVAVAAVDAMLAFREDLENLVRGERLQALTAVRIGLHAGEVTKAVMRTRVPFDGREEGRLWFDVWGHTVNIAARLEQAAGFPENRILGSRDLLEHTGDTFVVGETRRIKVKESEIECAEVVGRRGESR